MRQRGFYFRSVPTAPHYVVLVMWRRVAKLMAFGYPDESDPASHASRTADRSLSLSGSCLNHDHNSFLTYVYSQNSGFACTTSQAAIHTTSAHPEAIGAPISHSTPQIAQTRELTRD